MKQLLLALLMVGPAAGCAAGGESSPLIFGQGVTAGISVGASATSANTPEIVIGLKQADIAVVPTVVPKEIEIKDNSGFDRKILANGDPSGEGEQATSNFDALSTFGSFSNETALEKVTLGVFFATGVAAQNLSSGFQCALSEGKHKNCR